MAARPAIARGAWRHGRHPQVHRTLRGLAAPAARPPTWSRTDLERKHEKMRDSAFSFLRATYWRWAETVLDVCPELPMRPQVLAVGDIHLENFGTWRDADGRLVWGVNDFDEAAEMPYALDLIRLATSALLADEDQSADAGAICAAILRGYRTRPLGARSPSCSTAICNGCASWWSCPRRPAPSSGSKIERNAARACPAALSRGACRRHARARACRCALSAARPAPAASAARAGPALRTGAARRSCARPRRCCRRPGPWRGRDVTALIRCARAAGGRYRPIDPWLHIADGISWSAACRPTTARSRRTTTQACCLHRPCSRRWAPTLPACTSASAIAVPHRQGPRTPQERLAARRCQKMAAATTRDFKAWKAGGS